MCSRGEEKGGSDREERDGPEEDGMRLFVICVFIMGCLLSRHWEEEGYVQTAKSVCLLPWKPREMLDIKKNNLFIPDCVQNYCVCERGRSLLVRMQA